jgi:hypothetical protein
MVRILLPHKDCSASLKASLNSMILLSVQEPVWSPLRFRHNPASAKLTLCLRRGASFLSPLPSVRKPPLFLWTQHQTLRPLSAAKSRFRSKNFLILWYANRPRQVPAPEQIPPNQSKHEPSASVRAGGPGTGRSDHNHRRWVPQVPRFRGPGRVRNARVISGAVLVKCCAAITSPFGACASE